MSLRVIIKPAEIESWIAARQGTPSRRRGSDGDLQILFGSAGAEQETLTPDELIEAMKVHHRVLLVDDEPGRTFHRFIERG